MCVLQANIESDHSGDSAQQLQEELRRLRQENQNLQVSFETEWQKQRAKVSVRSNGAVFPQIKPLGE